MPDMNDLRQEIDRLDHEIIESLRDRFLVVDKIGEIKKKQNLPSLDENRWKEVLTSRLSWAEEAGVDKSFIKQIWDLIHMESLKIEDNDK